MAFGDRLRSLRINRDITQEQLAERVGVSRVSIGYYERGRIPPANTLQRLADTLGVPSAYLISGSTDENDDSGARWDQARAELECAGYEIEPLHNGQFLVSRVGWVAEVEGQQLQLTVEGIVADAEKRKADYIKHRLAAELSFIGVNPEDEKY